MSSQEWSQRELLVQDTLDLWRVRALHATLDSKAKIPMTGDLLFLLGHWIYFHDPVPLQQLGVDGHPAQGVGLSPPNVFSRRMWAGGQIDFLSPLYVGEQLCKISVPGEMVSKTGHSGKMIFLALHHQIVRGGQVLLKERQDVVYLDSVPTVSVKTPLPAQTVCDAELTLQTTRVQLFRYSALTFNSHRIHYDSDYARHTENYPDIVVQGAFLAQRMLEFSEGLLDLKTVRSLSFRAIRPLFVEQPFILRACHRSGGIDLWAADIDNSLLMTMTVLTCGGS